MKSLCLGTITSAVGSRLMQKIWRRLQALSRTKLLVVLASVYRGSMSSSQSLESRVESPASIAASQIFPILWCDFVLFRGSLLVVPFQSMNASSGADRAKGTKLKAPRSLLTTHLAQIDRRSTALHRQFLTDHAVSNPR